MEIHAPQLIFIIITAMSIAVNLAKHGQPQSPHSFPISLVNAAITYSLLWWGGFFGG